MARKTVINQMFDEEVWKTVNEENKILLEEFISYLHSVDRADTTIYQYEKDLKGFFCWYAKNCNNKEFVDIKKKDVIRYQNYLLNTLNLGSSRIRRLKSALSSLSNYIVNILDDEYPDFKSIINVIESPKSEPVREKTILSEEQLKTLLDELVAKEKYKIACYFAIVASSGMRKSEVFRLKVNDFDEEHKKSEALYKSSSLKTKGRGKKGKQLNKFFLISILEPYLSLWLEERKRLGIENEYLFANKSRKLSPKSGDYYCKVAEEILGLNFYSHSLRHYLVTYMTKHNVPTRIIKDFNGWENLEMVETYSDIESEDDFAKFFSKDGIKKVENKELNSL